MFFVSCQQSDDGRSPVWMEKQEKIVKYFTTFCGCFAFPRLIIWKYLRPSWCPHGLSYFFFTAHAIMTRVICKSRRTWWEKERKAKFHQLETINFVRWLTSNCQRFSQRIEKKSCGIKSRTCVCPMKNEIFRRAGQQGSQETRYWWTTNM